MMKVLLDTNFLMIPYIYRVDIFQEIDRLIDEAYELLIPFGVTEELKNLKNSKGEDKIAAQVALQLVERKGVKEIPSQGNVDEFFIEFASDNKGVVVCTNDKELKRRLRKSGISVITMRSKSRLEFI